MGGRGDKEEQDTGVGDCSAVGLGNGVLPTPWRGLVLEMVDHAMEQRYGLLSPDTKMGEDNPPPP